MNIYRLRDVFTDTITNIVTLVVDNVPDNVFIQGNLNNRNLYIKLDTIDENTPAYVFDLFNSLNWTNTVETKDYYLYNNTVIERPAKPGLQYVWNFVTNSWYDPRPLQEQIDSAWQNIIRIRNNLLKESDWTQLPDVYLENMASWTTYRQQLRDITNQTDPFNIVWPVKPV